MVKRKKKSKMGRKALVLLGLFALGTFVITAFAKLWSLLVANSNMVLLVSGSVVVVLILIGILSTNKVKKSISRSMKRLMA